MQEIDKNKRNLLYFEATSMRDLHQQMDQWQSENQKRFLSMSINKDGEEYCCIALTNPTEVILVHGTSVHQATVSEQGAVKTY